MNHNNYISFFQECAQKHKDIKHGVDGRISFFRSPSEEAFKFPSDGATPSLVLYNYRGALQFKSELNDVMTGFFEVRGRVNDSTKYADVETLKQQCKAIGLEIIARMEREMEDNPRTGRIPGFDINTVQYSFTDADGDNEYGCHFFFKMGDEAFNPYNINIEAIFNQ